MDYATRGLIEDTDHHYKYQPLEELLLQHV
ncbi:unnamed protein product [Spirodela intermedia]|uniref:Uncharacterized protein n=2 Tax=Spirodela intermedia TaxID=51605 RepID=A0A7I8ICM1_SPIIN|nr:unnamed protein product [Spirodela intermedia]CAA6654792.1 unnamed protein product [Spirodela intermedia]CAA7389461.1 unnamed protein product [Spirodela intermedia]